MNKTISSIIAAVVIIILLVLFGKYNRFQWVKNDESVVKTAFYDSLVAIANKPPVIVVDTIRDTIYLSMPADTIYLPQDTAYIEKPMEDGTIISDTLSNDYFSVFLYDEWFSDHIIRSWSSEVYKENYVTTIEVEKPVIKEVEVKVPTTGIYGGIQYMYIFDDSHLAAVNLSVATKKETIYGVSGGLFYNYESKKVQPGIGFNASFKF